MMGSSSQQFCVRWNSYQSNLQNSFPKLLNSENFVDVTLACEAQTIKCHKVVLSACSSYFETMLSQNPCQHPIIFMKDMKFWEIKALVDFMYRGEVNVTQEELTSLLKAAEALQVRGLYGYEQQRAAAACSENTNGSEEPSQSNPQLPPNTPVLPANTTLQSLQDTKPRSHTSSTQEDSNDQMVKLEEEIMMMEEQSISDNSHIDNDFSTLGSSQEFDSFACDQRFSQSSSVVDPVNGGPSGLTMTPNATSTPSSQDSMLSQQQLLQHQDGDIMKYAGRTNYKRRETNWNLMGSRNSRTKQPSIGVTVSKGSRLNNFPLQNVSCHMSSGQLSSGEDDMGLNSPIKRIRRSEHELSEAAGLISRGLTFQSVSDRYKIPISTIRFYMARRGILPRRKRGRTNRFDEMEPKHDSPQHNGPPAI